MTHIRKPNRRPNTALASAAAGDALCPVAGKLRYLDQRSARQAMAELGTRNADPARELNVYRCSVCTDWHVGHRP